jgi:hypothetical protein
MKLIDHGVDDQGLSFPSGDDRHQHADAFCMINAEQVFLTSIVTR